MATSIEAIRVGTRLVPVTCASCGVVFGLNDGHEGHLRRSHQGFYCPNGHSNYWSGQNDAERYKALYEQEQKRTEAARLDANHQREQRQAEERRARALKGVVTRTKRRVAHGVCPCCNRTFRDLAQHMSGQHPDYVKTAKDAPVE
jgi:hypothetical protein